MLRCCAISLAIACVSLKAANAEPLDFKPISSFDTIAVHITPSTPYEARYLVQWHGVNAGESTHRLTNEGSGVFHLESRTEPYFRLLPFRYYEHASFLLEANNLTPLQYEYTKKEGKKSVAGNLLFDQKNETIHPAQTAETEESIWSLKLSPDIFDKLTHTVKMRQDLIAGKTTLSYQVVEDGHVSTMDFHVSEKKSMHTALGTVNAVVLEHQSARRRTLFYLAEDYGYLLLQLEQFRDEKPSGGGKILSLSLMDASLEKSHS
ncbi:MAG: DUF3108 domain-containing protein [Pseudomonadota bacterium]